MRSSCLGPYANHMSLQCQRAIVSVAALVWCFGLSACGTLNSADVKRGDQHLAAGNWEEASVAYRQALKDDPFEPSLQNKYRVARERAAAAHDERGRQLLKDHQFEQAAEEFKRALTIEPTSKEYESGLTEALRFKEARERYREAERLAQLGRVNEAMALYMRAVELDPSYKDALDGVARLSAEQHAADRDDRQKQPVTLQFRNAGLKEVVEALGKAAHVNFVFDKDVRNDPITVSLEEKPFDEALSLVLNSNSLFAQKAGPTLFIISPNTKQKQEQYQDLMIRTFYLSSAKAKDMVALLKSMLDVKHIHGNEALNTIVVRDQPEKVELAEKIIQANDREDSEVLFDVEVLEVNRTVDQQYGLNYPKQLAAGLVPPGFTDTIAGTLAQQFTYRNLASLGQDNYLFKLPTNVQLDFFKQVTDAKTLAAPKVRVLNNKKAEVNIGDKQPILLSTTNVLPGQAATGAVPTTSTVTSIEFRDTGVKLTVEPNIHLANELSLKMKIEVIRLGDTVLLQQSPRSRSLSSVTAPLRRCSTCATERPSCWAVCCRRRTVVRRSRFPGSATFLSGQSVEFVQDAAGYHGSHFDDYPAHREFFAPAWSAGAGVLVRNRIGLFHSPVVCHAAEAGGGSRGITEQCRNLDRETGVQKRSGGRNES